MKYLNENFSVYLNAPRDPVCEICGDKANVYYQTVDGRMCTKCRKIKRENDLLKKLQ